MMLTTKCETLLPYSREGGEDGNDEGVTLCWPSSREGDGDGNDECVIHISFTQWTPLYLSKSTGFRGTPKFIGVSRGLSIFMVVRVCPWLQEALFGGVYGDERASSNEVNFFVFMR